MNALSEDCKWYQYACINLEVCVCLTYCNWYFYASLHRVQRAKRGFEGSDLEVYSKTKRNALYYPAPRPTAAPCFFHSFLSLLFHLPPSFPPILIPSHLPPTHSPFLLPTYLPPSVPFLPPFLPPPSFPFPSTSYTQHLLFILRQNTIFMFSYFLVIVCVLLQVLPSFIRCVLSLLLGPPLLVLITLLFMTIRIDHLYSIFIH